VHVVAAKLDHVPCGQEVHTPPAKFVPGKQVFVFAGGMQGWFGATPVTLQVQALIPEACATHPSTHGVQMNFVAALE